MGPRNGTKYEWTLPLPCAPILKPNWKRGQDGGTAIKIPMPQEAPVHEVKVAAERLTSSKRSYFKAFDAAEAQDAALAGRTVSYDHDLPLYPRIGAKKRRDSLQDDKSTSADSVVETHSPASSSPLPIKPRSQAPAIVLTTEDSTSSENSVVQIPKELEIDGNAGFDPHRSDSSNTPPKRTYLYRGRRYEVLGDEPAEWLKDVREVVPTAPSRASVSSTQPKLHSRSSTTPNSIPAAATRTRRSRRGSSN
jgi:hypothetical protein